EAGVGGQDAAREIAAVVDDARARRPQQRVLHPRRDAVDSPREDGQPDSVDPAGPVAPPARAHGVITRLPRGVRRATAPGSTTTVVTGDSTMSGPAWGTSTG